MAKPRSIGLTIFFACCAIYGRSAFLAPTEEELRDERIVEKYRHFGGEENPHGLLHGLRYYILGVGVIGLGIAVEDYYAERAKKRAVRARELAAAADEKSDPSGTLK